ncbi:hypothetical protein ACNKHL_25770 [Shigella flexneri]
MAAAAGAHVHDWQGNRRITLRASRSLILGSECRLINSLINLCSRSITCCTSSRVSAPRCPLHATVFIQHHYSGTFSSSCQDRVRRHRYQQ